MRFNPIERDIRGLQFSRAEGKALYIASIGMLRFEGYLGGGKKARISFQDLQNNLLVPQSEEADLLIAQGYQINNNPVFLRLINRERGRQVMFKVQAPREIQILSEEEFQNS